MECKASNTNQDNIKYHTGACAYEIWNSMAELHMVGGLEPVLRSILTMCS